jgi:transposase
LPAYTLKGYIKPILFKGSITAKIFQEWIRDDVLPNIQPPPRLQLILIINNCKIHKSQKVLDIANSFDVNIEFLPPYCPEFNLIEASFHDLKAYLRKWYKLVDSTYADFEGFLFKALRKRTRGAVAARKARAHFKHARYQGVPEG